MKADAAPLLSIFEKKMRLEVPLFQRQYVWTLENQWEPLWEDIERKFTDYLNGRKDAPVHFLGAMVLDLKQTPTTHVEKRQVIDGQQRLTTLQIFLAAFRDFCKLQGCDTLASECQRFLLNDGMMANPEIDRFKVWPTQADRTQFVEVISSGSRTALEKVHPLIRKKYTQKYLPRPRMVEAYVFFHEQLRLFFLGTSGEPPLADSHPLPARLEEAFQALKGALYVAVIDLDKEDDAQVIFETLNARGEPLLPADLLRNYIFLRAGRTPGESQEALYSEFWKSFDEPFWREEIRQGRLKRPRSDLFMQHFLSSRQGVDIPIRHLFVEYKFWIEKQRPFGTVREELSTLSRQGADFRRLLSAPKADILHPLATFLISFDIGTAYPLLLNLLDRGLNDVQWRDVTQTLQSYILRRAVGNLTTKSYNRVFLAITKLLQGGGDAPQILRDILAAGAGESSVWPSDDEFRQAWRTQHAYAILQNTRLVYILSRLSETYQTGNTERIDVTTPLTVEHLMPQQWLKHWPLPDGSDGMTDAELWTAPEGDQRAGATRERKKAVQTIGNLTLVTQPLNSSMQNEPWETKKPAVLGASLLPINLQLQAFDAWNEETIRQRSDALFERALRLWPRPAARSTP